MINISFTLDTTAELRALYGVINLFYIDLAGKMIDAFEGFLPFKPKHHEWGVRS